MAEGTYGYRYSPTSRVFELPGLDLHDAAAEVDRRRSTQAEHGGPITVELMQHTPDGWHLVRHPSGPAPAPQARHHLPPNPGEIVLAGLPRHSGPQ